MTFDISSTNAIQGLDISNMDIETALLAVQSQRANLLEDQLKKQLEDVQKRNNNIISMNETLNAKRSQLAEMETEIGRLSTLSESDVAAAEAAGPVISAQAASDASKLGDLTSLRDALKGTLTKTSSDTQWIGISNNSTMLDDAAKSKELAAQLKGLGLSGVDDKTLKDNDKNGTVDATAASLKGWVSELDSRIAEAGKVPEQMAQLEQIAGQRAEYQNKDAAIADLKKQKTDLSTEIDNLKTSIDSEGNSQQMEMLRLQSLSNKRNEAFDMMSNFIKKMQDSRSAIISNMR